MSNTAQQKEMEKVNGFVDYQLAKQNFPKDMNVELEGIYKLDDESDPSQYLPEPYVAQRNSTDVYNAHKEILENSDMLDQDNKYHITANLDNIKVDYENAKQWLQKNIKTTSTNRELEYKIIVEHLQGKFEYVQATKVAEILGTNAFTAQETAVIWKLLKNKFYKFPYGYQNPNDVPMHVSYTGALLSNPYAEGTDRVLQQIFELIDQVPSTIKLDFVQAIMISEFGDSQKKDVAIKVKQLIARYDVLKYGTNQSFLQELGLSETSYTTNQRQAEFFLVWNLDEVLNSVDWLIMGQSWEKKPGEHQAEGAGFFGEKDSMQYSDNGVKHYILKFLVFTYFKNTEGPQRAEFIEEYISIEQTSEEKHDFKHYVVTGWYGLDALNIFAPEDLELYKDSIKTTLKSNLKKVIGKWEYSYIARECWAKFMLMFIAEDILVEGLLLPLIFIIRVNVGCRYLGKLTFATGRKLISKKALAVWYKNKAFRKAIIQNMFSSKKTKEILISAKEISELVAKEARMFNYSKPFANNFNMYGQTIAVGGGRSASKGTFKAGGLRAVRGLSSYFRHIAKVKTIRIGQHRVPYETKELFYKFIDSAQELGIKFTPLEQTMLKIVEKEFAEMAVKKGAYATFVKGSIAVTVLAAPPLILELFDSAPYEAIEGIERSTDGINDTNEETCTWVEVEEEQQPQNEITDMLDHYLQD